MSFTTHLTILFTGPTGAIASSARYPTSALLSHSKTLRSVLIYQHPDPPHSHLSTHVLDPAFQPTRDPGSMKLAFDFLLAIAKAERRGKAAQGGEWALREWEVFAARAGLGDRFWEVLNVYACMLELRLDADTELRCVTAALRTRLRELLHRVVPAAREVEFAWRALGATAADVRLFRAVVARAVTCLKAYCGGDGKAKDDVAYYDHESQDAAAPEGRMTTEATKVLRVVRYYPTITKVAAEMILHRWLPEGGCQVTPENREAWLGKIRELLVAAEGWMETFEQMKRLCEKVGRSVA